MSLKTIEVHRPPDMAVDRWLTAAECRAWLAERSEGRLGHDTGRGRRAVVVPYAVTDGRLVFRLPEYNEINQYAPGRPITLEVDSACPCPEVHHQVTVTGIGYRPDVEDPPTDAVEPDRVWPPGHASHLLCLDLTDIRGCIYSGVR
jgi:hypothetical protein